MAIRNESDQLLANLKTAIENLTIDITSSVGDVTVNTSGVEALLGDSGNRAKSGAGLYPVGRAVGGSDAEGAAPTVFPVLTGGRYDVSTRELSDGRAGAVALNINGHVKTESIIASGTVTANLSSTDNAVLDAIDTVLDNIKVDTEAIETATEAILAKNTEIEISANALVAANHTDLVAIEASADALIAANHTDLVAIDAVLDAIKIDTQAIETAVEAIHVDTAAMEILLTAANTDHAATEALLTTIDADTSAIATDIAAIEVLNTAIKGYIEDTETNTSNSAAELQSIKNAVELLDNAIAGTEMQVDVVASLPTGSNTIGTVNLSATDNAALDAMVADLAALETLVTAGNVDLAAIEVLNTAIKTAVEVIDNAIAGNEMQVDIVASLPAGSNAIGSIIGIVQALPAGTNAIGKLAANSGVDIGDVDVTSIVPGTGATNLGKAEDATHTSGDVGVMPLAVRNDSLASLSGGDGDYAPMQVDAKGALYTNNQFGTFGNILVNDTTETNCDIASRVFVAIYMLTDTVFASTDGLVAETAELYLDDAGTGTSIDADGGGTVIDGITFPAGMTLYGRYDGFTLASGSVIAYVG